jgi:hypothetical protein
VINRHQRSTLSKNMANIDLERRSRPTWLWAFALLALLVLLWLAWITFVRGPAESEVVFTPVDVEGGEMVMQPAPGATADEVAGVTGGSVARFVNTCGSDADTTARSGGAAYEMACLREMTNALAGLVLADTTGAARLDDDLRDLRRQVQSAEQEQLSVASDPSRFGEIAQRAVDLMAALQTTRGRSTAENTTAPLARARTAANGLRAAAPGDAARGIARQFFTASAEVLRALEANVP